MSINLENYSAKELAALIAQASQRQKKLKKRKPAADVRKRINTIAREAGYTIAELFGGAATATKAKPASHAKKTRKSSTAGTKVAPKYRNPDKPSETWAARGKHPRWLAAEIAKGRKLEEFAIK
ncbi:MAG: H-NS histone family protein [Lysobacteraceae bacterium]